MLSFFLISITCLLRNVEDSALKRLRSQSLLATLHRTVLDIRTSSRLSTSRGRVKIEWFNDLTIDAMLKRVADMPPKACFLVSAFRGCSRHSLLTRYAHSRACAKSHRYRSSDGRL